MNRTFVVRTLTLLVLLPAGAFSAPRAFVKSTGRDANPCSLAAPCRNFTAAVAAVDAGGEVVALDSAGYGPFTVNKALTVSAPLGVYAGVSATSGHAVTVAAGASDVVVLRGLSLKRAGGWYGINFTSGSALHVENCVIGGDGSFGIAIESAAVELFLKDTVVRDGVGAGVYVSPSSGTAQVTIEGSRFANIASSICAVFAGDGAKVAIHNSAATGGGYGFCAVGAAELNLRGIMVANNFNFGVLCQGAGATVRVADALVTGNAVGFKQDSGCVFKSLGNNLVDGNAENTSGTITPLAGM